MRGILVRVAVDQAFGKWNGPVDPATNDFVYVSIPDTKEFEPGLATPYGTVIPALAAFASGRVVKAPIALPSELVASNMHLDPDFDHLTYGDTKQRARDLATFGKDDIVIFYSGLKPCRPHSERLVYAIIGLYTIAEIVQASDVSARRWHENAHTRRLAAKRRPDDVIVRGRRGASGRLTKCIPIGEWRDGAYRVKKNLLQEWGDLSCKDGFIQRSAVPPRFKDPERFLRWFEQQEPSLVAENNPT